jgi:hypothetical protein
MSMIPKTIIHLLSGGLDSVTMLYDLKAQGQLQREGGKDARGAETRHMAGVGWQDSDPFLGDGEGHKAT